MKISADAIIKELTGAYHLDGRILTDKRKDLIRFLCEQTEAKDAVSIWLALRGQGKKISIASVYMMINWLTERGYIKRSFDIGLNQYRYRIGTDNDND